jgi:hypothetical protein
MKRLCAGSVGTKRGKSAEMSVLKRNRYANRFLYVRYPSGLMVAGRGGKLDLAIRKDAAPPNAWHRSIAEGGVARRKHVGTAWS